MDQVDIKEAVAGQFKRVLHMFSKGIDKFSAADWRFGDPPDRRPAAQAYHLLESVDFFAGDLPSDQFSWGQRFGVDWECEDPDMLPSQVQVKAYLDEVEGKLADWFEKADLFAPESLFQWTGQNRLERSLYSLRHAQHHVGELSRELEIRGLSGPRWR